MMNCDNHTCSWALAVELSLPVLSLKSVVSGAWIPTIHMPGKRSTNLAMLTVPYNNNVLNNL